MTERDIEIFLTIIEKKNLSKAASALFMSPSSLASYSPGNPSGPSGYPSGASSSQI